jgi:hypothetical protein
MKESKKRKERNYRISASARRDAATRCKPRS